MARRQVVYLIGITVISIAALVGTFVAGNEPLLGLDLQGGVSVRYRTTEEIDDPVELEEKINQAVEVIRNRVDGLGVAEPEIQAEGNGILVSLPGVDDQQRALDLVGETAVMRFRPVIAELAVGSTNRPAEYPAGSTLDVNGFTPHDEIDEESIIVVSSDPTLASPGRYVLGPTGMTGDGLSDAQGVFNGQQWIIAVELKGGEIGEDAFRELTTQCFFGAPTCPASFGGPGRIAVDLDNQVISAPAVQSGDLGDSFIVSGNFTQETSDDLALKLRFGALPIQLEPEDQQLVSATIGKDALEAGVIAGIIGLVLVAIFIIGYYRILGVIAMLSLLISAALLWSIISFLGASQGLALTLAGITGIIVSIGVSVDSNIVYFEHLKEDVRNGRTVRTAVNKAFPVAFSTIVKADMASLIGAVLLYALTVGAVRGFALYLGIATILDLIATYFFMGPAVQWITRQPRIAGSSTLMGIPGLTQDRVGTDEGDE
ncbi:MAG: preprotein translocase subunit SecD [Verrucomicrobiales bacterium]|jgi:preprotein translocase subunit SecD